MSTYECRGSGEIGGAPKDFVGWCIYCKKIQRMRVGTGRLHTHWTSNKHHAKIKPVP